MDYLDGNLSEADRSRFERHLSECPLCTEHLKQVEVTVALTGQVRDDDLDPRARDDLMRVYRQWRDDQQLDSES
jgi:anti-sigma factor RsiW